MDYEQKIEEHRIKLQRESEIRWNRADDLAQACFATMGMSGLYGICLNSKVIENFSFAMANAETIQDYSNAIGPVVVYGAVGLIFLGVATEGIRNVIRGRDL